MIFQRGTSTFVKTSNNEIYGDNECSQLGIKTDDEQNPPSRVFEDNKGIGKSNINKTKAKSARSIL